MKKSIKIILISVLSLVVVIGAVLTVAYFNPKIWYAIGSPVDKNEMLYSESVTFCYQTRFGLPLDNKTKEFFTEFSKELNAQVDEVHTFDKDKPMHIIVDVEYDHGKTIFNYSGYAYKNGEKVQYEKTISVDRKLPLA